ncbi:MAG: hypothetical protein JO001_04625 [Alphaproteobacteria bacterium]|nr:hypothetical protein [Alphaproteobacteria bacterium]
MKGWMMLVSGPDTQTGHTPLKRLVAVAAGNSDEAFEAARAAVPGCVPASVGPLTDDATAALGLTSAKKSSVIGTF